MTAPAVHDPNAQTVFEIPDTSHYRIDVDELGCEHCHAGAMYTITYPDPDGGLTAIGTSWADQETAEDICDLMNMAYEAGRSTHTSSAEPI